MRSSGHSSPRRSARLAAVLAACVVGQVLARDLFIITVREDGNPSNAVTVGSSSLIDLISKAIESEDEFASFEFLDATASLSYGGVENAIVISKNAANTMATLNLVTGFSRTFTGVDQDDLEDQIEDFLKKDGSDALTDFLSEINKRTVIALSDGNPLSTTARMAASAWDRFGLNAQQFHGWVRIHDSGATHAAQASPMDNASPETTEAAPAAEPAASGRRSERAHFQVRFRASGAAVDADGYRGSTADFEVASILNFHRRVGLSSAIALAAQEIEGAEAYHAFVSLGLPIRIITPEETDLLQWQVTPFGTTGGSGSEDLGAGGLIVGGGIASCVSWNAARYLAFTVANQYSIHEGETLSFQEFELNPGVEQQILKNGIAARLGNRDGWSVYTGITHTQYLEDAAVEEWITPTAGVTARWGGASSIDLAFVGDFADNYETYGGRLSLNFGF